MRGLGIAELLQFDWTLVGEAGALAETLARAIDLAAVDEAAVAGHLAKLRSVIADRRQYLQIA